VDQQGRDQQRLLHHQTVHRVSVILVEAARLSASG
jgi:hypothetical protein